MLKKYIFILVVSFSVFGYSQKNKKTDSLKIELKNNTNINKFEVLNLLAWEYVSTDLDSLQFYKNLAKGYIKAEKNQGQFLLLEGCVAFLNQDLSNSEKFINKSIAIAQKVNDFTTAGSGYNLLSKSASLKGNFVKSEQFAKLSLDFALKGHDKPKILKAIINYGSTLIQNNKLDEGIKYYKLSEKYFYKGCDFEKAVIFLNLGNIFTLKNDCKNAELYLQKANVLIQKHQIKNYFYDCNAQLAELYLNMNESDKAQKYLQKAMNCATNDLQKSDVNFLYAQLFYNMNNSNQAIQNLSNAIKIDQKTNPSRLGEDYVLMGQILKSKQNFAGAEDYFVNGISIFEKNNEESNLQTAYKLIIGNFFLKENLPNYAQYFDKYIKLNDKFEKTNNAATLLALDKKYQTKLKETKIKTQQLQIQKEKTNKNLAFAGIGFLIMLSGFGYLWIKTKQNQTNLKTQNTLLGLQQNLVEAELANLNKQLDPHEIKNLLASISPEIQDKAPESYKKMLKLFNLTKASLNSNSITDSLENQLQQIDDFLSLEKSMLTVPMEYIIKNTVANNQTQIPRLLLKNLVENSIKHGIKHQENGGNIEVQIIEKDNFIYINVDDTGKGRNHAISLDSGIGTTTYQKLFATLNPKNKQNASFDIIDKQQGTKVEVRIPLDYKYV